MSISSSYTLRVKGRNLFRLLNMYKDKVVLAQRRGLLVPVEAQICG